MDIDQHSQQRGMVSVWWVFGFVVLIAAGYVGASMYERAHPSVAQLPSNTAMPSASPASSSGLGGQIYEQSHTTVGSSVPQTNPFEAKTNPFQ